MRPDLTPFGPDGNELERAWYIVELQASMISDQKAIIKLQDDRYESAMNLVRLLQQQIKRLRQVICPVN